MTVETFIIIAFVAVFVMYFLSRLFLNAHQSDRPDNSGFWFGGYDHGSNGHDGGGDSDGCDSGD